MGYIISGVLKPSYYYGRRHDYVYYPEAWTDQSTGTYYEKGYYDENGQYYDSVAFPKNGTYENVVCSCPYCGQNTILNLSAEDAAAKNLQCPHCNGPMEIVSELDDYINQPAENTHTYASENPMRQVQKKQKKKRWGWIIAILILLGAVGAATEETQDPGSPWQQIQQIQEVDPDADFSPIIVLNQNGANSFTYAPDDVQEGDKVLLWDEEYGSYYDLDSDCWLWYNDGVEPAVWQYWYEGISSDFGEYGWMEHDNTGWYIEASEGNWVRLPNGYDTAERWYIEES